MVADCVVVGEHSDHRSGQARGVRDGLGEPLRGLVPVAL